MRRRIVGLLSTRALDAGPPRVTLVGMSPLTADEVRARIPRAEIVTAENIADVSRRYAHPHTDASAWGRLRAGDLVWTVANPGGSDLAVIYLPRDGRGVEGAYGRNGSPADGGGRFAGTVRVEGGALVLRDDGRGVEIDMVTGRPWRIR